MWRPLVIFGWCLINSLFAAHGKTDPIAIFWNDTFTAPLGTSILAYTGGTGATYSENSAFTRSTVITAGGRLRPVNATGGDFLCSGVPLSANDSVTARVYVASINADVTEPMVRSPETDEVASRETTVFRRKPIAQAAGRTLGTLAIGVQTLHLCSPRRLPSIFDRGAPFCDRLTNRLQVKIRLRGFVVQSLG